MGVFPEDEVIRVSRLTKLWVAEGFLKPIKGKNLEEIAKEYLKDLIDRNLILIQKEGSIGSIKHCKIHDMLRELCLREAEKERFYIVARHGVTLITQRRIVISNTPQEEDDVDVLQSVSLARSLIWNCNGNPPSLNLRLLRIFECSWDIRSENMFHLVNLRHFGGKFSGEKNLFSSLNRVWNLETLNASRQAEIWCMPQIRQVDFDYDGLLDPPSGSENGIVLENLHTLTSVGGFKCSEEVVKRIPNLKKLRLLYWKVDRRSCLNNLVCLNRLVSLDCTFMSKMPPTGPNFNFPQSLRKLKIKIHDSQCWEDILEKIGSLPLLEKLTLRDGCFEEGKWESAEVQFQGLKYLEISECYSLKQWTMESSHFPHLEHLVLSFLHELEEIPLDVAEIPTLGSIELRYCSESAAISARRIVEEQEESNGEVVIQVRVLLLEKNEAVESLATHRNIRVQILE